MGTDSDYLVGKVCLVADYCSLIRRIGDSEDIRMRAIKRQIDLTIDALDDDYIGAEMLESALGRERFSLREKVLFKYSRVLSKFEERVDSALGKAEKRDYREF